MTAQQIRAALLPSFPDAGTMEKYITKWGSEQKLWEFRTRIGAVSLATLAADYYADALHSIWQKLSKSYRDAGLQRLAGLSGVSRGRIKDMYPHTGQTTGGYTLNIDCQVAILEAIGNKPTPTTFNQGPNLPLNPATGKLEYPLRVNEVYTVLTGGGQGQKNYIFDNNGMGIAEVDFGNHGGDAVSGHCHPFGIPGMVNFAHHNAGGVHLGLVEYPVIWRQLPVGVAPQTAIGT
jgi:hypothetical protein